MTKELYSTPGAICIEGLVDHDNVATVSQLNLKAPIASPQFTGTVGLPSYLSTALPSAVGKSGHIIWVSDLHSGRGAVCFSDGAGWWECQIHAAVP